MPATGVVLLMTERRKGEDPWDKTPSFPVRVRAPAPVGHDAPVTDRAFQVDLRGVVDLLSHHLYSGPRVYLRELLQNSTDAITARRRVDATCPAEVLIVPSDIAPDGMFHCVDTGTGLTAEEITTSLTTIGASHKRDELGFARQDYLGQFGIGMLSCFLISDEIELLTRTHGRSEWIQWWGRSSGDYRTLHLSKGSSTERELADLCSGCGVHRSPGPGTWIRFHPRRGSSEWTVDRTVTRLATEFGQMLDVDLRVARSAGPPRPVTGGSRLWGPGRLTHAERIDQAERLLRVKCFDTIPVSVPEAGLQGQIAILDAPAAPSGHQSHRVYVKNMLVGSEVAGVLPSWAFFARALVNADQLRLTASREEIYQDDLLERVRSDLADQLRRWLLRTAEAAPERFAQFLDRHETGARALAVHDDDLYRAMLPWLRFETTIGRCTVPEFRTAFDEIRYTATVDEFRQLLPIATAQQLGVVNAGHTHALELLERLPLLDPTAQVTPIRPGELAAQVGDVPDRDASALEGFLGAARRALSRLDVQVRLRRFEPSTVAALVLDDRESQHRRRSRQMAAQASDVWAGILTSLDDGGNGHVHLLLNDLNPTVRRVSRLTDPELLALAVESLYCQALLLGHHQLRPADTATLHRSFLELLDRAVGCESAPDTDGPVPNDKDPDDSGKDPTDPERPPTENT
jgi:molecular chaperone HtpG